MRLHPLKPVLIARAFRSSILLLAILTAVASAQTPPTAPWSLLEAGLGEKSPGPRSAAIRVLGLIPNDSRALHLAENGLQDRSAAVRAAAATALGQMHALTADTALRKALNDKDLPVVLAAAHALRLLNDPKCYDVYYEFLTGERKDDSSMVSQELKVLRDPKQMAQMGSTRASALCRSRESHGKPIGRS